MRFYGFRFNIPLLLAFAMLGAGCSSFIARRIAQAPNSYPTWLAPDARVTLDFGSGFLTNFPAHYVDVGPPDARLRYRIVDPADYHLKISSSNWMEHGTSQFTFSFDADVPGASNHWTGAPRGTVVLLHGWGVAQFAMAPWALRLAEDGWRCVLVDLRGHGKSTGDRVYFGTREVHDMEQLLDRLQRDGQLVGPVAAVGESYGGALGLRWEGQDSRVRSVVAIAPYAELSNAIVNIRSDYAGWLPGFLVRSGIKKLPEVLNVSQSELDMTSVLATNPVPALLFAGTDDQVAPVREVEKLNRLVSPGSEFVVVPGATHEALTYFFDDLTPPIIAWLDKADPRQAANK